MNCKRSRGTSSITLVEFLPHVLAKREVVYRIASRLSERCGRKRKSFHETSSRGLVKFLSRLPTDVPWKSSYAFLLSEKLTFTLQLARWERLRTPRVVAKETSKLVSLCFSPGLAILRRWTEITFVDRFLPFPQIVSQLPFVL